MRVTHLSLTDFRNYEFVELALASGSTLFVGSNGQGKTNLVEALGYLSTLGSHRTSIDHAMIRSGAASAIIRARLEHHGRAVQAEVQLNRGAANQAQVNGSTIRPRELPRYFSSVLFAPEDVALVRGEPSGRRRFMDELLVLRTPRLSGVLADYDRVLRQRNSLLKSARAAGVRGKQLSTLDIWDERLVALGAEIIEARGRLVAALSPELRRAYTAIAGSGESATLATHLSIHSNQSQDDGPVEVSALRTEPYAAGEAADAFRAALSRIRAAELERGITLAGPHRDDLVIGLNGLPARGYASQGESWSLALALKLASAAVLRREATAGDPVLILDDVFAELDESRRERLADAVADFEQVLITAAVLADVPGRLVGNVVRIQSGAVVEEGSG